MLHLRLIGLIFCLLLIGCNQQSNKPSCFRMNLSFDPASLDPRKARNSYEMTVCRMLFEGLTRISKTGKPELALAESVDISEDGLTYAFHLRHTMWSNGEFVTSSDFAETWKQMLDPNFPTDMAYQLYVLKNGKDIKLGNKAPSELGVETPDPFTLIVHLEGPVPYFLEVCAMSSFLPVPQKIVLKHPNWMTDPATSIGNGPFQLKRWDHTDEIRLSKNLRYWDACQVHLQEVSLVMVASDTEIQMFEDGKLDMAGGALTSLPMDAISHLRESGRLQRSAVSGTRFLRINTAGQVKGKFNILSHAACRKAFYHAIDREEITKHLLYDTKTAAYKFVPPEMQLHGKANHFFQNKGIAKTLFNSVPESKNLEPIVLSFVDIELNRSLAQVIQQQLEQTLGIQVLLEALELKVFYQKVKERDYQVGIGSWIADFNDPINFLEVFKYKDRGSNNTNWQNEEYIELLNASTICQNQIERKEILGKAEEILLEDMPIVPLYHEAMNFLQRPQVSEIALSPIGQVDLRWIRMEE